jgi:aminopeptidase N
MRKLAALLLLLCAPVLADTREGDGRFGGEGPRWAPTSGYDLKHVALAVVLDVPGRKLTGEARLTLAALTDGLAEIPLHARDLHIRAVADARGAKLGWGPTPEGLAVRPAKPLKAAEEITLVITYDAAPQTGLYFRGPDKQNPNRPLQAWTQGEDRDNSGWAPLWDYPNDRATSELTITAPAALTVVSNGKLLGVTDDKTRGTKTWRWKESVPHVTYLISFVAAPLEKREARFGEIPVEYYVAPGDVAHVERTFGRTPAMLELFSRLTGVRYPYEKYAQVVVDGFMWGGMENISATTMFADIIMDEPNAAIDDMDELVAHELAHQWFGDLVTTRDWTHLWLNEGFAMFMELVWTESRSEVEADRWRHDTLEGYLKEDGSLYRRPIVTSTYPNTLMLFDSHTYNKGGLVLHMLRRTVGDTRFWAGVREYLARHQGQVVDTHDFAAAMRRATGDPLDWFFDQWLFRAGFPALEVGWSWDATARQVTIDVSQTQAEAPFRLPVTVEVWSAAPPSGKRERRTLLIDERKKTLTLPAATRPVLVLVDPDREIVGELTYTRPVSEAVLHLAHPRAAARLHAADLLADQATHHQAAAALARCAASDTLWRTRQVCAKSLAGGRAPGTADKLAPSLIDPDARVRLGAAQALGRSPPPPIRAPPSSSSRP